MKAKSRQRSFGLGFLVFLFLLLFASQTHTEESVQANVPSGWSKAKKAFDRLMWKPSTLTAREFYFSISDGKGIKGDKTEILDHIFVGFQGIFSDNRYLIIATEMLNRDIYAARSAIRLLDFVDNGWQKPHSLTTRAAGWVGESLGQLIRVNPTHFLRACYEERENPYLKEKGFPVGFIPSIMSKKTRASYELEMRREALRSVEDAELRSVRDECIGAIDRELEKYGSDSPGFMEQEERTFDDPKAKIKNVFAEMQSRPSPENMKRVLDLFPEVPGATPADVIDTMFPPFEVYVRAPNEPLGPILREARCGNEYAIEVLFRALVHVLDLYSIQICSELSNLILMKPALFIEKLAKYAQLLDSVDSIREPDRVIPLYYFEWTCVFISSFDYPFQREIENVILRRRIDALAALNMPEHKELIDRCIRVIEKKLKGYRP
jgi:hypothetical protein